MSTQHLEQPPRQNAFAMGRRIQIAQALAAGRPDAAANLIHNSPDIDWRAFVGAAHHPPLAVALGLASALALVPADA